MRGERLHEKHPQEYTCWKNMKSRAKRRGDTVAPEFEKFKDFLDLMGKAPSPQHTIDQQNLHLKLYSASNCRWATKIEQANNRRNTRFVTMDGERVPLADVARRTGQKYSTLRKRVARGFTDEEIIGGRTASPPNIEEVDELSPFLWVGNREQTIQWRNKFHGGDEIDGVGTFPWNSDNLSFEDFVLSQAEELHDALRRDDMASVPASFKNATPPPKGPKREALLERLEQLSQAAFERSFRMKFAGEKLVDLNAKASQTPWIGWIAGETVDAQKLLNIRRMFSNTRTILPPPLLRFWEERKAQFLY